MSEKRKAWDVSVNICTYNRCGLLGEALEGILCQAVDRVRYEVIVVDNNSSDATREVVESFVRRGHSNLRYLFESRQGLSYARNTGVAAARAAILAFTDDDVRVAPDWVETIKRALDDHPEVDCVGGKVLPTWTSPPPAWLTHEHWAPLAIVDYGDRPFYVNAEHRLCLVTANMAIRTDVLKQIGRFQPELQRVQDLVGSMEDHELLIRLWKAGRQGLYLPKLVATSEVIAARLEKQYHRRWHLGHGRFCAMARLEELERSKTGRLFDVSAHLYRQAAIDAFRWFGNLARRRWNPAFVNETGLLFFAGFVHQRYKEFLETGPRGRLREVATFARSFARSRLRRPAARAQLSSAQSRSPKS